MRKIYVIVENTQSRYTVESEAKTLGELKGELLNMGVSVENDSNFLESRSKSVLVSDDSPLPEKVMHRGQETEELVFMVRPKMRKITSGADRTELYAKIRKYSLAGAIKEGEGKNFTQVPSSILEKYIEEAEDEADGSEDIKEPGDTNANSDFAEEVTCYILDLIDEGKLPEDTLDRVKVIPVDSCCGGHSPKKQSGPSYDELAAEFEDFPL